MALNSQRTAETIKATYPTLLTYILEILNRISEIQINYFYIYATILYVLYY